MKFFSFVILCLLFFTTSCSSVSRIEPEEQKGGLRFEKEYYNFGEVTMGDRVETLFRFKNISKETLKITDLISTCGCTVAKLEKYEYLPDEEGEIKVLMDTTLKNGLVSKTITLKTNDLKRKEIQLSVTARVKMPPHPPEKSVNRIMSDECRLCHIEAGKGLESGYLYHQVCWQCHGSPEQPPKSINLFNKNFLKNRTDAQLYEAITKGISSNGMPSYLDEKEGRGLTKEQIESLIQFIRASEEKEEKNEQ